MQKHNPLVMANAYKDMMPRVIDHEGLGPYLINMSWATSGLENASHSLLTGDRLLTHTHGWKDPAAVILFSFRVTVSIHERPFSAAVPVYGS